MSRVISISIALATLALAMGLAWPSPEPVSLDYPQSWPEPRYDFDKNPLTQEGIALGRQLFYDPILSIDSSVSCANCHLSYTAFTHVDHALSHGVHDSIGDRNSMALMNLAWSQFFMWDGAVNHLDMQALAPMSHPSEMGEDIAHVVDKLKQSPYYPSAFKSVFGTDEITGERLLKALSQFQLTFITDNSKYDKVIRGEEGIAFTQQEAKGYTLFQSHCASCHTEPFFSSGTFANNGLPLDTKLNDTGRMRVTGDRADSLKFKVPTLRNIEFTRPYMHDGRFNTLSQVLDHYTQGLEASNHVDGELMGGVELTDREQKDLIAFLLTLSDREFLFDSRLAYPRD